MKLPPRPLPPLPRSPPTIYSSTHTLIGSRAERPCQGFPRSGETEPEVTRGISICDSPFSISNTAYAKPCTRTRIRIRFCMKNSLSVQLGHLVHAHGFIFVLKRKNNLSAQPLTASGSSRNVFTGISNVSVSRFREQIVLDCIYRFPSFE